MESKDVNAKQILGPVLRQVLRIFRPKVLCTWLMVVTGVLLVFSMGNRDAHPDSLPVAVVFGAALLGRCMLVIADKLGARAANLDSRDTAQG